MKIKYHDFLTSEYYIFDTNESKLLATSPSARFIYHSDYLKPFLYVVYYVPRFKFFSKGFIRNIKLYKSKNNRYFITYKNYKEEHLRCMLLNENDARDFYNDAFKKDGEKVFKIKEG